MKRITAMLLSLLLGAGLLTVCWRGTEYHREDTERENGVTLYVRRDRQAAFAGNLTWDGQSDTVDYVIPDRVDGAPVTALGGLLYGTAFKKLRCSTEQTISSVTPNSDSTRCATPSSSRIRPSSRCSEPT